MAIQICGIWVTSNNEKTFSCKKHFIFWILNNSFTFWCKKIWTFDVKTVIAVIQAYIGVTLFHSRFATSCVSNWSCQISCLTSSVYLRFSLLLRRHGSLLMVEEKCTSINWNWWSFRMVELTIKLTERQHVMPKGQCQTPLQRKTSWVTGIIGWYFDIWLLFQLSKGIRRYQEMRRFCCLL